MTNTLYDALLAPHARNKDIFLECDDGRAISFAAFVARAAQMANVLVDLGIKPGDRVVVQAPKLADVIALFGGSVQAGAVYLPLNTGYTQAEVAYFIEDASPKLIICDASDATAMLELCGATGTQVLTLGADGSGTLSAAANVASEQFETVARGPDDLAALLYTSGTTGRSKGAMLTHQNLLSNATALVDIWQITKADRLIHALPIFHTHGLFVAMNTSLLVGATVRFMAGFDLDAILSELPKSSTMMDVPTFYTKLLNDERFTKEICTGMRLFVSGSAPLLAETHTSFQARTGHRILERYGMTEANMITSNPYNSGRIAGTVGFALPDTEVVITDNGTPVASGEIGMIEVRGPGVFLGYWNMPEKTRQELRDTGFFITGDLGIMDNEGRISIVGREKDLIISGGLNIYPKEVEDILNGLDGILESAVFGVPHPDFGESVVAAIVQDGAGIDEDVIGSMIGGMLAKFKHPHQYIILEALPRNAMGKVQKNTLREQNAVIQ